MGFGQLYSFFECTELIYGRTTIILYLASEVDGYNENRISTKFFYIYNRDVMKKNYGIFFQVRFNLVYKTDDVNNGFYSIFLI